MDALKGFISEKMDNLPKPQANFKDLDLKGVSMDGVDYLANIAVDNPYPAPIPICGIEYILKSDDRVIVSGTMPDPGSMKAKETTMLEVPLKVPHSIVLSLVRDIMFDWDIDYELNIVLVIDLPVIGDIRIPVNQKGELKLPSIKDVFKGNSSHTEPLNPEKEEKN